MPLLLPPLLRMRLRLLLLLLLTDVTVHCMQRPQVTDSSDSPRAFVQRQRRWLPTRIV
jgi:hypothetical protein